MADLPSQPKTNEEAAKDANVQTQPETLEISPRTEAMVEQSMPHETEDAKRETKQLVEAIKQRAQQEVQGAQQVTLDMYLGAVRKAKDSMQGDRVFDPEKIEHSIGLIQADAQKNMNAVLDELKQMGDRLGDRLSDAAKAAWNTFKQTSDKEEAIAPEKE